MSEPVEIGKPRTWVPFKKELCATCWSGCCHSMPVEVSVNDLIRLGLTTEEETSQSIKRVTNRLKKEGFVRTYRAKSMIFVLEQKASGDCIFLNENRQCSVYEKRPEICRLFPKIGPKPGHCPYQKK